VICVRGQQGRRRARPGRRSARPAAVQAAFRAGGSSVATSKAERSRTVARSPVRRRPAARRRTLPAATTSALCQGPEPIAEISTSPTPMPTVHATTSSTTRRTRCPTRLPQDDSGDGARTSRGGRSVVVDQPRHRGQRRLRDGLQSPAIGATAASVSSAQTAVHGSHSHPFHVLIRSCRRLPRREGFKLFEAGYARATQARGPFNHVVTETAAFRTDAGSRSLECRCHGRLRGEARRHGGGLGALSSRACGSACTPAPPPISPAARASAATARRNPGSGGGSIGTGP